VAPATCLNRGLDAAQSGRSVILIQKRQRMPRCDTAACAITPPMPTASLLLLLLLLLHSIPPSLARVRENPNGGGFQVFESTNFFEFTNATEYLLEWVNNVGNSVNQGPLYEEAQDFGGGVVYGKTCSHIATL
jgi:hypothetical protein